MNSSYHLNPSCSIFSILLRRCTQPQINFTPNRKAVLQQLIPDRLHPTPQGNSRFPITWNWSQFKTLFPLMRSRKVLSEKRAVVAKCVIVLECEQHFSLHPSLSKHRRCWMKFVCITVNIAYNSVCVCVFLSILKLKI